MGCRAQCKPQLPLALVRADNLSTFKIWTLNSVSTVSNRFTVRHTPPSNSYQDLGTILPSRSSNRQWDGPESEPLRHSDNLLGAVRLRGVPATTNRQRQPKKFAEGSGAGEAVHLVPESVCHVRVMVGNDFGLLPHSADEGRGESNLYLPAGQRQTDMQRLSYAIKLRQDTVFVRRNTTLEENFVQVRIAIADAQGPSDIVGVVDPR